MTKFLSKPVEIVDHVGQALEEGKTYDLIGAHWGLVPNINFAVVYTWYQGRHNQEIYPVVAKVGVTPDAHIIIKDGVARKTNPPEEFLMG